MKLLIQTAAILGVVGLLTGLTYLIKGEPNRYPVEKDPDNNIELNKVPDGQITLKNVIDFFGANVVWVDARSRSEWEFDGVRDSIFITSDPRENMDQLIDDNIDALFASETGNIPIVIYCGNSGCTDSEMVKKAILDAGIDAKIFLLHKGYSAIATWPKKLTK